MNSSALKTLLAIEDNAGDARLLREMLREEDGHNTALVLASSMVETKEELQFIKNQGCDEGQGYYFSRPLTASDFARQLALTSRPETRREMRPCLTAGRV
ncbi:MAG: hypothetical protein LC676_14610 [Loktanella sp.]|nr:hypothetical protein [Loktanella sp.]